MTDPHLDDAQLSLLLDGLEVAGRAHVEAGCATCGDRLAALRAARDAVAGATVAPLPADVLDRLVATALDATAAEAEVVPLGADRPRARQGWATPPPAWLVGAAAGIALLVGVAGVLRAASDLSGSGDDASLATMADGERDTGTANRALPPGAAADSAGTAAAGATVASDPELVVGDLADQDDPAVLARALEGLTMKAVPTAGALSTTSEFAARQAAPAADAASEESVTAPPVTTIPPDRAQCRVQADAIGAGRFGALLSTATLRWKGQPAEVLVFRLAEPSSPDAPETRQALVLSRPGCELLADPRF